MKQGLRRAWHFVRWLFIVLLLTVILLEGVLQVAAFFLQKHDRQSNWLHPGNLRVLTMGDSNTYGLYLEASQAYPVLVQQQWNQHHPDKPMEVINLGYPGTNSSRVLKSLPDVIKTFSPDVITVMVGVNDFWMAPVAVEGVTSPVSHWQAWLRDHSRVYKLAYLLHRQAYNATLLQIDDQYRHATFDESQERAVQWQAAIHDKGLSPFPDKPEAIQYGDTTFDIGYVLNAKKKHNPADDMRRNFERMVDIARQSNVKLVFITYAYFEMPQKSANQQMKVVSKEKQVPLILATQAFREQCALGKPRCDELFFPDFHPSRVGHQLLANVIEQQLSTVLQ